MKYSLLTLVIFMTIIPAIIGTAYRLKYYVVGHGEHITVTHGKHLGRHGLVVSHPCGLNLWHTWLEINVEATEQEIRDNYERFKYKWAARFNGFDTPEQLIEKKNNGYGPRYWIRVRHGQTRSFDVFSDA